MRRSARTLALAPLAALFLSGCPGDLEDPQRFTGGGGDCADVDVPTLFEETCGTSACHEGPDQTAPVDLVSPGVAGRLVDVPPMGAEGCTPEDRLLIDPTDVQASYLLEKIDGSPPECGDPMPILLPALSEQEVGCVEAWIREVAGVDDPPDAGP